MKRDSKWMLRGFAAVAVATFATEPLRAELLEKTKTLNVKTNVKALENHFTFVGVWHGGTFTKKDHRGATAFGYATAAAYTNKGTFELLKK